MPEKKYPENKPSMHKTVRIAGGLHEAIDEFLKTPMARRMGYRYKTDVITDAVRHLFTSINFYKLNMGWAEKEIEEKRR